MTLLSAQVKSDTALMTSGRSRLAARSRTARVKLSEPLSSNV